MRAPMKFSSMFGPWVKCARRTATSATGMAAPTTSSSPSCRSLAKKAAMISSADAAGVPRSEGFVSVTSVLVQGNEPLHAHPVQVVTVGCRLPAVAGQVRLQSLSVAVLGRSGGGVDVGPGGLPVLHVVAAAVERVGAEGCTHHGVGAGDRGGPRVGSHLLVGDDLLHLHDRPIGRP